MHLLGERGARAGCGCGNLLGGKSRFENIDVSMMEVVYLASLGSRPWAIKLAAASCCCAIAVACEGV